jgi:hypothetical protein
VLVCAYSRVTAGILNVEKLAPRVCRARIWWSLSAESNHRRLSSILVQMSAVSGLFRWERDIGKDTIVKLNALLSILNLLACLHGGFVRSLEVRVRANTRLLAWLGDEVELTLRNAITFGLTEASALLDNLLSSTISKLVGANTERKILLLKIVELTVRNLLASCVW